MLILLPPSEGKTAPAAGNPVDLATLWLPQLATSRQRVLSKLVAMCSRTSARSMADSLRTLGLSEGQKDEVVRNASLVSAPAAPASEVYTGVLYEALDLHTLPADARAWVESTAVVFSGLWGAVRLGDRIPAYRCSVGATLAAPVGGLGAYWKKNLTAALDAAAADGPVLDLRSGAYAAMWAPGSSAGPKAGAKTGAMAGSKAESMSGPKTGSKSGSKSAAVRVLHERTVGGVATRSVVSHFNKATKGRMVRALAGSAPAFASIDEVVDALRDLKFTVEERPAPADRPRQLDVVVSDL